MIHLQLWAFLFSIATRACNGYHPDFLRDSASDNLDFKEGGVSEFLARRTEERLDEVPDIRDETSRREHDKKDYKGKVVSNKFGDPSISLSGDWPIVCEEDIKQKCDPKMPYRTFDGRCNNLKNPTWGQSNLCLDRLLPADYGDGKEEYRLSVTGKPLPNPRVISTEMTKLGTALYEKKASHMLMQFGQLLTHEVSQGRGREPDCCDKDTKRNPLCRRIMIPKDDPFYSKFGVRCHSFFQREECTFCKKGPREIINTVTSFIDANSIYGSEAKTAASLRDKKDGLLLVTNHPASGELLPLSREPKEDGCSFQEKNLICFRGADNGTNITPGTTSMLILFVRDHNRIARGLKGLNPKWSDDRVYFEARQIVSARMQMITYNEYLPAILGEERTKYFDLKPLKSGYTKYEPETNPTIVQSFAHGAYRFGHSQTQSFFSEYPETDRVKGRFLRDLHRFPWILSNGELEPLLRGLLLDKSLKVDSKIIPDHTNFLFRRKGEKYGQDLFLLDIMRARDHGIPGYTKFVRFCKGPKIEKFSDLDKLMPKKSREMIQSLYKDVEDIDLIVGGMAENHEKDSLIGPTFSCIVGIQFYRWKFGDRFYFEHGKQAGSFTPGQLETLRKTLYSKLICEVTNIKDIQKEVMYVPSKDNPLMRCNEIPDINLTEWKEKDKKDDKKKDNDKKKKDDKKEYMDKKDKEGRRRRY